MRLIVKCVLEVLAVMPDRQELMTEYPGLEEEDVSQALAFAASNRGRFNPP